MVGKMKLKRSLKTKRESNKNKNETHCRKKEEYRRRLSLEKKIYEAWKEENPSLTSESSQEEEERGGRRRGQGRRGGRGRGLGGGREGGGRGRRDTEMGMVNMVAVEKNTLCQLYFLHLSPLPPLTFLPILSFLTSHIVVPFWLPSPGLRTRLTCWRQTKRSVFKAWQ